MLHAETCVALKGWFTTEMLEMIRIFKQSIHVMFQKTVCFLDNVFCT